MFKLQRESCLTVPLVEMKKYLVVEKVYMKEESLGKLPELLETLPHWR